MIRLSRSSKRGFTLLETMLAVALLLIVTLIAYEGFMTTLNYAGDTALADRVSNQNAGDVYTAVGQRRNLAPGNRLAQDEDASPDAAIMIKGSGYVGVYQVGVVHSSSGMSIFSSGSELTDEATFVNTTNRHGFYYFARRCPECGKDLLYYEETDDSGSKIIAKCPDDKCSFAGAVYNK